MIEPANLDDLLRLPTAAGAQPDAALVAAEAELARLYAWLASTREAHLLLPDGGDAERGPVFDEAAELDNFIARTPCTTLAGAAVKLRRMLDEEFGLPAGRRRSDIASLAQVLALLHGMAGEPAHATRPIASRYEDDEVGSGE